MPECNLWKEIRLYLNERVPCRGKRGACRWVLENATLTQVGRHPGFIAPAKARWLSPRRGERCELRSRRVLAPPREEIRCCGEITIGHFGDWVQTETDPMVETRQCGQCGKPLPQDAPAGLCPECLLRLGMQSQSQPPADSSLEGVLTTAAYGQAAADVIQDRTEHRHAERLSLTAGQPFGGYRIVRRLGSGGMGAVYEADHLESGRRVALKVLPTAWILPSPSSDSCVKVGSRHR